MAAEHDARAADDRLGAEAGQRLERLHGLERNAVRGRARDDGAADRMLRARLERGRQLQESRSGGAPFERRHADDVELPFGQRAGLVERDAAHVRQTLEVRAPFDQHALARRGGERGDDRDRRRNDQRARARDDEQHERAVDPAAPRCPGRARAARCPISDGEDEHGRRVDPREPIDERLAGRALRLRPLDEVDDPRERGVAAQPLDLNLERAAAVDRSGEHLVARLLLDRAATRRSPAPGSRGSARPTRARRAGSFRRAAR